jgi:serine/threonine protein kinase
MSPTPTDRRVGPYVLAQELGAGAMGTVYLAHHRTLKRPVALKLLSTALDADIDGQSRFRREMRLLASVTHPNVVGVYDAEPLGDEPYIAMELLKGESLQGFLAQRGALPSELAVELGLQIAEGVAYLHENGILHRDLKPSNIFLTQQRQIKLIDFGLAWTAKSTLITEPGLSVGTPLYMAPELLRGASHTPAADIWSLGCVMYFMLTGRYHVDPMNGGALLHALLTDTIRPPAELGSASSPVSALVMSMLARAPGDRPSAQQVVELLHQQTPLRPATAQSLAPKSRGNRPTRGFVVAILLSVVAIAVVKVGPPPRVPPPSGSPSGNSRITPAPAPTPRKAGYFQRWQVVEPLLAAPAARSAGELVVTACRRSTGMDFGPDPRTWSFWVHLGRWLEADRPSEPPRSASAVPGQSGILDRLLMNGQFEYRGPTQPVSKATVAAAVGIVDQLPDDGQSWLALGRVLELEGDARAAAKVYRVGLDRGRGQEMNTGEALIFEGLARALVLVPGHRPAREWWERIAGREKNGVVWTSLNAVLTEHNPQQFLEIMRSALTDARVADRAGAELSRYYWYRDRLAMKALAALEPALKRFASRSLAAEVARWQLALGRASEAEAVLRAHGFSDDSVQMLEVLYVKNLRPPPGADISANETRRLEVQRLLESGDVATASQVAKTLRPDPYYPYLLLDLLGAGSTAPWVAEQCVKCLFEPAPNRPAWILATGALSSPAGVRWMEKFLTDGQRAWPKADWLGRFRALWLARRNRVGLSLEVLESSCEATGVPWGSPDLLDEILSRAVWTVDRGPGAAPDLVRLERLIAKLRQGNRGWPLSRGSWKGALPLAEAQFSENPGRILAMLRLAWAAAITPNPTVGNAMLERIQISVRYQKKGVWLLRLCQDLKR